MRAYRNFCGVLDWFSLSVGGVGVSRGGVELVPVDAGAVSHGNAERLVHALRASLPCPPVEALESFVGHRVGREPRVAFGPFRVLVAPPADRLQPSDQPQSAVAARHVAQARVP